MLYTYGQNLARKSHYENFDQSICFQLSGIDYRGMTEEWILSSKLTSYELRPYLDRLLDEISMMKASGIDRRVIYIASLPLCSASIKYKNYFIRNKDMGQFGYLSKQNDVKVRSYDSVKAARKCLSCLVYEECAGTYKSAFDLMGDALTLPF